jgi:predicted RNA binding protein YcfA (HicA-like mRNA interferase family)
MPSQKLPILSSRKLIKILKKEGFVEEPIKRGSHRKFVKKEHNHTYVTIVPKTKHIGRDLLNAIIEQSGHTRESFLELL